LKLPVGLLACAVFIGLAPALHAEPARELFEKFLPSIHQIRVINIASGSRASLGSGFLVGEDGLIASNYHVIAEVLRKPGEYRAELEAGPRGPLPLRVVDVDVVNDLALLQAEGLDTGRPIALADTPPAHGQAIYSLGNPLDLGMTVVPGTYNGLREKSFQPRIHFSGSVNPGMSGGPVLTAVGEAMGINVSTRGNQMSFLVPADHLAALLRDYRERGRPIDDFPRRIEQQLVAARAAMTAQILASDWTSESMGDARIVGSTAPFVECWGDTSEDEKTGIRTVNRGCHNYDSIHLNRKFNTGQVEYQFTLVESPDLSPWQSINVFEQVFGGAEAVNRVNEDAVTNFRCNEEFITGNADNGTATTVKAHLCVRDYKAYPTLHDVFYIAATTDRARQMLMSHFTLSGVSESFALAFTERFVRSVGWR